MRLLLLMMLGVCVCAMILILPTTSATPAMSMAALPSTALEVPTTISVATGLGKAIFYQHSDAVNIHRNLNECLTTASWSRAGGPRVQAGVLWHC